MVSGELQILQEVSFHPNITELYGITRDSNMNYYLILQRADYNLREYLRTNFSQLQWDDKLNIAENIACGLKFLHDNNIIHRDLHTKNILVFKGKVMIADFGHSLYEASEELDINYYGVPAFVEPRFLNDQSYKLDKKSDIFSLGVILWEVSSGQIPFKSAQDIEIIHRMLLGGRETPVEGTPQKYVELYKQCWDQDPENRPNSNSAHKILENFKELRFS
ncbi:kinase-like domain-containing protein [Gigaspora rosea]|uniref:Kinase-like domain-containing protein n=1 Tax=Gigaspora rosea TaxID=44941 RepID=A0A397U5M4_9GLOM|nr:kinase-like domain-containing protein [Gigaspora rosea]